MKTCKKCGGTRIGARGKCLDCKARQASVRYYANRERLKAAQRDYNSSDLGVITRAKYKAKMHTRTRFQHNISCIFGLTVEDYARMYYLQGRGCACCQKHLLLDKHTHVDHDHATGKVRALLCHSCNTSLGLLEDSPARVTALLKYIESHKRGGAR